MRNSVTLMDILIFIPAVLLFSRAKKIQEFQLFTIVIFMIYPGLILIDHGHFQVCSYHYQNLNFILNQRLFRNGFVIHSEIAEVARLFV